MTTFYIKYVESSTGFIKEFIISCNSESEAIREINGQKIISIQGVKLWKNS